MDLTTVAGYTDTHTNTNTNTDTNTNTNSNIFLGIFSRCQIKATDWEMDLRIAAGYELIKYPWMQQQSADLEALKFLMRGENHVLGCGGGIQLEMKNS